MRFVMSLKGSKHGWEIDTRQGIRRNAGNGIDILTGAKHDQCTTWLLKIVGLCAAKAQVDAPIDCYWPNCQRISKC